MRNILLAAGIIAILLGLSACEGGSSGTLMGRVVDGFGYPLGGDAVMITLSDNPAFHRPDQHGNFIVRAPVGDYTMTISFSNPAAGFNYRLTEQVRVSKGSKQLGTFTLLNVQNMQGWESYRAGDYSSALAYFSEQANLARSGQIVWLPYMRYVEGDEGENTLLTQGVLSAENGLGWTYSRGFHNLHEGLVHYQQSLAGGYNNYDAKVGLTGIAIGDGDGQAAFDYVSEVIDEPGYYDSSQIHDDITEVDLIAIKSFAQFLLGQDGYSRETAQSIEGRIDTEANPATRDLLAALEQFR
jgi:hypothetical protein